MQAGHCGLEDHAAWLCKSAWSQHLFPTIFNDAQGCTRSTATATRCSFTRPLTRTSPPPARPSRPFFASARRIRTQRAGPKRLLVLDTLPPSPAGHVSDSRETDSASGLQCQVLPEPAAGGVRRYLSRECLWAARSATTRCALPAWRRCNLRVLFALSVSPHTLITICI